ncbi:hypothetical protein A7981_08760 [Methylovorus sp. MM2]|uniref:SRPBCC family protein n=1 Tax=Methylovorus sp. MM2 TaxID=1848038 RepID=UPI0007DFFF02|nr:SRPBCC family protein [Methylovorus sp. MM2]OAM51561.1 hypothetical protein A7981_08760 [Methylovorus sp. MM2]
MRKFFAVLMLAGLSAVSVTNAIAGDSIKVKKTITINAPANEVWAKIGNFGDMSWHPAIAKTDITGGTNNKVGASRQLTLKGGGTINEVLTAHEDASKMMTYEITESVLPLREYSAKLVVKSAGDGKSLVIWTSKFKRKDPASTPQVGQDDKTAKDTITGIFTSGLDNLKKLSE